MKHYDKVKTLSKKYHFNVEYVTNEILELDENGKCNNPKCKCHKIQ